MTSTLPNFSASPAAATLAGSTLTNPSALASFTALSVGPEANLAEFATLLGDDGAAVAVAPVVLVANAPQPVVPGFTPAATAAETVAPPLAVATAAELIAPTEVPAEPTPAVRAPSDEEIAAAAAFVATLLQAFQPAAPQPVTAQGEAPATEALASARTNQASGERVAVTTPLPNGRAFPTSLPVSAKPVRESAVPVAPEAAVAEASATQVGERAPLAREAVATPAQRPVTVAGFTLPNGAEFPTSLPLQAKPPFATAAPQPAEFQLAAPVSTGEPSITESAILPQAANTAPTLPEVTVATDGAIECRLDLVEVPNPAATEPKAAAGESTPLEVQAELELPGQAVVRVELQLPANAGQGRGATALPEKFAASAVRKNSRAESVVSSSERNFVFTGDKELKSDSPVAGIGVAKPEPVISTVPTEEIRQPRNPETLSVLPARADFQVAQPTAERITVEPAAPAGQNFAERAVATVTSLAEAQFTASMQKAGSVQLRLKFGGEDLSVRVELRGDLVHTDFRTDSPALREAIATEWQAVAAASPAHLQRFLDPVFSPATPGTLTDSGAQHQSAHRQAQQQGQEHSSSRHDPWSGQSPFTRRSALSESFVPEPATPRVPVLLPTSLRLSALA